ncbi:DUF6273 domain-containing protein [Succinimonas amylolytica]|uniref:DUF6273 domain-containing protein n=1 Tax=Succinimonas amylolytica TaxID=83769 RepID=UPI00035D08A2|nr:DUF6273 domain-containing protein [Succinimonas amylolytica]
MNVFKKKGLFPVLLKLAMLALFALLPEVWAGTPEKGGTIAMGTLPAAGTEQPDPLIWKVLDVQDDRALLITEKCPDAIPYHTVLKDITWEGSAIRKWLNEDFFQKAFTASEKDLVLTVKLDNPDNAKYPTKGGNPTEDRVFLLSNEEVLRYFPEASSRVCAPSSMAVLHKARRDRDNGNVGWWTRTPGFFQGYASYVLSTGVLGMIGHFADFEDNTVRPAMWIRIR